MRWPKVNHARRRVNSFLTRAYGLMEQAAVRMAKCLFPLSHGNPHSACVDWHSQWINSNTFKQIKQLFALAVAFICLNCPCLSIDTIVVHRHFICQFACLISLCIGVNTSFQFEMMRVIDWRRFCGTTLIVSGARHLFAASITSFGTYRQAARYERYGKYWQCSTLCHCSVQISAIHTCWQIDRFLY